MTTLQALLNKNKVLKAKVENKIEDPPKVKAYKRYQAFETILFDRIKEDLSEIEKISDTSPILNELKRVRGF